MLGNDQRPRVTGRDHQLVEAFRQLAIVIADAGVPIPPLRDPPTDARVVTPLREFGEARDDLMLVASREDAIEALEEQVQIGRVALASTLDPVEQLLLLGLGRRQRAALRDADRQPLDELGQLGRSTHAPAIDQRAQGRGTGPSFERNAGAPERRQCIA